MIKILEIAIVPMPNKVIKAKYRTKKTLEAEFTRERTTFFGLSITESIAYLQHQAAQRLVGLANSNSMGGGEYIC